MRIRLHRSERRWQLIAEDYRDQLASAHRETARLSRELAIAERRARDLERRPEPVMPQALMLEWSDGWRDTINVRSYVRTPPRSDV